MVLLSWDKPRPSGHLASSSFACRRLCCALTARLELEAGGGGWEGKDGPAFPINERVFPGFKGKQEHLGDFGKVN